MGYKILSLIGQQLVYGDIWLRRPADRVNQDSTRQPRFKVQNRLICTHITVKIYWCSIGGFLYV